MTQTARSVLTSLVLASALVLSGGAGAEAGPKYSRIPLTKMGKPPAKELAALIAQLKAAVKAKDESLLLSKVADDYQCLRDFGGACEEGMNAAARFKSSVNFETGDAATRFAYLEELLHAARFARTTAQGAAKEPLTCAPAVPQFDEAKVAAIDKRHFQGDDGEFWLGWIALEERNVPVFSKPQATAKRLAPLSRELVHLASPPADMGEGWTALDLPSGGIGFVEARHVTWLLPAQLCYRKHPKLGWQIAAHVGGGD